MIVTARAALEVVASLQLRTGAAASLGRQKTMERSVLWWMKIRCSSRSLALVGHVVGPTKGRNPVRRGEMRR